MTGELGRTYEGGEIIVQEGDKGDFMFVVQEGEVEVVKVRDGKIVRLAVLGEGDFFGEMALFNLEVRTATVRAQSRARLLTVDKRTFLRRIQQDPSLAFRIVETMSHRICQMNDEVMELRSRLAE